MRKLGLAVVLFFALALAACGGDSSTSGGNAPVPTDTTTPTTAAAPTATTASSGSGSSAATISMGGFSFSGNTDVTIKAGQAVKFDDSTGGSHMLVTGSRGTFSAEAGAPSEFGSNGLAFNLGDVKTVTFPTAGTYHITCTFHPSMEANVIVTP